MKKTIWLMVILFVMAGGIYTYIFFANRSVSKANQATRSCCPETTATASKGIESGFPCTLNCSEGASSCPALTSTAPINTSNKPSGNKSALQPNNQPCDNCVCGTGKECPNEEKCNACLEEEQQKQGQNQQKNGQGNGNGNKGQHRNGR